MADTTPADLLARMDALERSLRDEIGQRIRAGTLTEHRLLRLEAICLMPALSRRISGPIPWLWRLLGLQWKPPVIRARGNG